MTCFHEFSEYESTIFVLIFSNPQNWEKCLYWPILFVCFFNWEILVKKLVDSYLENSWKHVVNSITDVFLRSPPPPPRLSKEQKLARGVIVVNKAKQRKIRKASSSSSSKSTLDDSGQNKFSFKKYIFLFSLQCKELKGVFSNFSFRFLNPNNFFQFKKV